MEGPKDDMDTNSKVKKYYYFIKHYQCYESIIYYSYRKITLIQ